MSVFVDTGAFLATNNIAVAMDMAGVILSPRIKMVFIDAQLLEISTKTFKQYSGKNLSFTGAKRLIANICQI